MLKEKNSHQHISELIQKIILLQTSKENHYTPEEITTLEETKKLLSAVLTDLTATQANSPSNKWEEVNPEILLKIAEALMLLFKFLTESG